MDEEGAERSCPLRGFSGRVAVRGRGPRYDSFLSLAEASTPRPPRRCWDTPISDIRMTLAIYTDGTDSMQDAATAALERTYN
jgi:hypothetical protein